MTRSNLSHMPPFFSGAVTVSESAADTFSVLSLGASICWKVEFVTDGECV